MTSTFLFCNPLVMRTFSLLYHLLLVRYVYNGPDPAPTGGKRILPAASVGERLAHCVLKAEIASQHIFKNPSQTSPPQI